MSDKVVHEQTGELRTLAMLANTGTIRLDCWVLQCENCGRCTTTGLCGCSSPAPTVLHEPKDSE